MSQFLITQGILLINIFILLYFLSWFWPPDSPWAPWWSTNKKTARIMCKMVKLKKNDIIYDLGSGEGTALIVAAKEYGINGVGVEIDPLRVFVSKWFVKFAHRQKQITILKKNFFEVDISEATVIFAYLVPKALERLKEKLLTELRPGTRIVCYRYEIPYLPLIDKDIKRKIYIYAIPVRKLKVKKKN